MDVETASAVVDENFLGSGAESADPEPTGGSTGIKESARAACEVCRASDEVV